MEVVRKKHERMYLFSQSILLLDSNLTDEDDYWSSKARKLFNLTVDPTEQTNLAAQNSDKVAELEALLASHNAEQVEPLWPSVFNSPQLIDKTSNEPLEEGDEFIYWPN